MSIDTDQRRARLGRRHHLAQPSPDLDAAISDLIGLHASDPATVYLSSWARCRPFARAALEEALYERRSLVRMLGMRRTMFVVRAELWPVIDAACTRAFRQGERRRLVSWLEEQGVTRDGATWLERVERDTLEALEHRGEATAAELSGDVPELTVKLTFGHGKTWAGAVGVSTRVLFLMATEGRIVRGRPRGTWVSSQYRWVPARAWLGHEPVEVEERVAREELLRRWLLAFGPGTETDLRWWTGWKAADTRLALDAVGAIEVSLEGGRGFVLEEDAETEDDPRPWVALLPALDSSAMGWKEREWFLGGHGPALFDRNGNVGPTVWADGAVVGGWAQRPDGGVVVELLDRVDSEKEGRVTARATELQEWLGEARFKPRFRTPLEKELAAT